MLNPITSQFDLTHFRASIKSRMSIAQSAQLKANGQSPDTDHYPVAKFTLTGFNQTITWLVTEIDPSDSDLAYGLIDYDNGAPRFGTFRFSDIEEILNITPSRIFNSDKDFTAQHPISIYAAAATLTGRITEDTTLLDSLAALQSNKTTAAAPIRILKFA